MSVYFFAAIDRKDLDIYGQYETAGFESIAKYNVEALAVTDALELIEGGLPGHRIILLKFDDRAALRRWYDSPEYQRAIPLRHRSADTPVMISFEGLS
ncbi:DUF1330 domain-containing protein [Acidisoma silvae]|uniref:DUF1330 domain-containing protein n=1 Tax=Acidisoma silvae TaxID=2802396 RepID=A0A963YVE7_9PROT|nr:DUF1330 domain-containing protein [Acidisoma silvae]MCB8877882.1 DUF1330 domain-containing protein [Acidisoma silvae]